VPLPFYFYCFIFRFSGEFLSFRECFWAHCFARGSVLDFRDAVRACAMRRCSVIQVHSPFCACFGAVGPFISIFASFHSLQYIYEDMYCNYPSVCLWSSQRQPEILSFILSH
jgi:hypothetical protein